MENGATGGPFFTLSNAQRIPCLYVPFECKNYGREVGNPELDQLAGRLFLNRGKAGFLCYRNFANRITFIKRCRDTIKDDRGLIIPLDDKTVVRLLKLIEKGCFRMDATSERKNRLVRALSARTPPSSKCSLSM